MIFNVFPFVLQADNYSSEKIKLSSDLENVQRQNKGLVKKVKKVQCQLQAMVDKLKKKKKKVSKCTRIERKYLIQEANVYVKVFL